LQFSFACHLDSVILIQHGDALAECTHLESAIHAERANYTIHQAQLLLDENESVNQHWLHIPGFVADEAFDWLGCCSLTLLEKLHWHQAN